MKATRLVDVATKSIIKNKMRTLLTMLGIIIGVGAVIVMVAVGQGAKGEIQRRIDNLGTNMIVITQAANRQGGVSQGAGSAGRLTIDDYTALKREGLLLSQVSPERARDVRRDLGNLFMLNQERVGCFMPLVPRVR